MPAPLSTAATSPTPDWMVGGGELGALIRRIDWSATPLGPAEGWPQSLRSAISILLPSKAQIALCWGPELIFLYNDAYAPVLGAKHPWALGRPLREVWSELWLGSGLKELFDGVLQTGEAFWASDYPFMMERHGFTEETYFDISYDPIRDESGAVGGVFCIVSDTTGRVVGGRRLALLRDLGRRTSEARSVAEVFQRAAAVLEEYPRDVAFASLLDASGRPQAHARADRAAAWPIERLRDAPEVELHGAALEALGALPGGAWPEPCRSALLLPIATPGLPPYGYLVVGASPRRPLDEGYRDFLRLIAPSIAAALSAARALEEQRAQAEALAELDRAKTAFFSNVSHEFRTPLTLLLGPLQDALAAPQIGESARPSLETARSNGLRLLKLVNTLLDFSRIEAGRAQASYVATDLARFTAELASNFRSACEKAGLCLAVDCEPLAEPVYVDHAMWEKIVLNLLSNALKFTFEGGIEVALRGTPDGAQLSVRDSGIGIAEEELPRIFERFHRVEGARARTHEGSGIGLAFVRELTRLHGGEITVESEPGRGSKFTVLVPFGTAHLPQERVRREANDPPPHARSAPGFVEEAIAWLRSEAVEPDGGLVPPAEPATRVLVVDDNADMRAYVARLLGSRWRVETATNGREALERLAAGAFDLVVSDVMMPEMDGFALLRAIRAQPALAELPVLLVSARAGEESRLDGIAAGADDYIVKPFTAQQLLAQVGAQLTIRRARRTSAEERERLLAAAQAARRDAELQREHLFSLFMRTPNPIVILRGPEYVIELANPPACRVWGRTHDEVVGRRLYDAIPELQGQGFKELLDGVLQTGAPYEGKEVPATLRRAQGALETLYFNFVYTPLRNVHDQVEGILVTASDVTEEVLARRQMSELRNTAEAASRAKDEFLAMLSHELRNPLAPIVAATQLMRLRGAEVPELATLERQTAHLTRLVDDLLDVSRITRGKVRLRLRRMEVAEAVARALEMAAPLLENRAHPVDVSGVAADGLAVDADPERLVQIVFNLISNAARYSDSRSPIRVRAERAGETVRLSVADAGIGIAPDMLEGIFEMFVQQPPQRTIARSQGGLGLGLTIVRSLVEMHGGRVWARSDGPGCGSDFTVELRCARARSETDPAQQRLPARTPASRRRVMVVDDNVDAATALSEIVRILGHDVAIAHDGARALELAQQFRPEVALIDIGLPVMDGYDLAHRLQTLLGGNAVRLVAITGYGQDSDRTRSAQAGFIEHLVKPVELAALDRLLTGDGPRSG